MSSSLSIAATTASFRTTFRQSSFVTALHQRIFPSRSGNHDDFIWQPSRRPFVASSVVRQLRPGADDPRSAGTDRRVRSAARICPTPPTAAASKVSETPSNSAPAAARRARGRSGSNSGSAASDCTTGHRAAGECTTVIAAAMPRACHDRRRWQAARSRSRLETRSKPRIGSRWLLYVGVVAIVVGVSYFEKLAIDNHWVGERPLRVIGRRRWPVSRCGGTDVRAEGLPCLRSGHFR